MKIHVLLIMLWNNMILEVDIKHLKRTYYLLFLFGTRVLRNNPNLIPFVRFWLKFNCKITWANIAFKNWVDGKSFICRICCRCWSDISGVIHRTRVHLSFFFHPFPRITRQSTRSIFTIQPRQPRAYNNRVRGAKKEAARAVASTSRALKRGNMGKRLGRRGRRTSVEPGKEKKKKQGTEKN